MRTRCAGCKRDFTLEIGKTEKCPTCGRAVDPLLLGSAAMRRSDKPTFVSNKQRARRERERAASGGSSNHRGKPIASTAGSGGKRPQRDRRLASADIDVEGRLMNDGDGWSIRNYRIDRVEGGEFPITALTGRKLLWRLRRDERGRRVATPVECEELRDLRTLVNEHPDGNLAPPVATAIGPQPRGSTLLERLTRMEQLVRIDFLARIKDDRAAWSELASCWHIEPLRKPLATAMASIGWEKLEILVSQRKPDWPEGVVDFVIREATNARARRERARPLAPIPWYNLADW